MKNSYLRRFISIFLAAIMTLSPVPGLIEARAATGTVTESVETLGTLTDGSKSINLTDTGTLGYW